MSISTAMSKCSAARARFLGQHVAVPLQGVAVHINAFNFPVWGMLEKLAPALLAGVPSIVKPATQTCYLTEACVRLIIDSGILPEGAVQLVIGRTGDLLDRLGAQDVVAFTGSADTALMLRGNPALMRHSTRFMAEQDSLNASILGPDAAAGQRRIRRCSSRKRLTEITTKAGQKCTAMRRLIVPAAQMEAVAEALTDKAGGHHRRRSGGRGRADGGAGLACAEGRCAGAADAIADRGAADPWRSRAHDDWWMRTRIRPSCRRCCWHAPTPMPRDRVHEVEAFGPALHPDALPRYRPCGGTGQSRRRLAGVLALHRRSGRGAGHRAGQRRLAWPHLHQQCHHRRRRPRAMARPCRIWSMAGRAAQAAARSWAAFAA